MQQIPVRGGSGSPVALERLSAGQSDPRLLLAGCSDGRMRLYDLRAGLEPVAAINTGRRGGAAVRGGREGGQDSREVGGHTRGRGREEEGNRAGGREGERWLGVNITGHILFSVK